MALMATESLNPLTLPLQGTRLIEASAGTGKTYTLAALYLRLLLGLGGDAAHPRPLSVEEILVVTFTEAATEELRGRIRDNIHQLRLACVRGKSEDPLLAALLEQLSCLRLAALHLLAAERQMDEAAIYTIHGFCQRILNQNAVESGMLFQQTLLEDESFLRQQVSADFWRRHCYPLPLDVARMVQQHWEGPENLLAELLPYLQGEPPAVLDPPNIMESILSRHVRIIAGIEDLKRQWRATSATIRRMLDEYRLDRRVYSRKNLLTWLAQVDRWASEPTVDYRVPDELARFKSSVLADKTTAGESPRHELFAAVEAFYQQSPSLRELIFAMALTEMRQALEREKGRRAEMGFDDLMSRLDRALAGGGGKALAASVRTHYPVAMIDEFQDTDPQQYRIFCQIYGDQPGCGMLLIGDPKQAIYAFRGADIFTYMRARSEVDAHYTLDTNWRSAPGMINAVNQLFQSLPAPFIFDDIPFLPVASAASNVDLRLVVRHQPQPALRVWLQPGAGVGISEYQQFMAHQCAATIRDWLYAAREGEAWLEGRQGRQPLQASDITVLVRNRNEAVLIRDVLAALMIPAVYLSNRDSVFETPEARELQWILQAVLTPEDIALRRALATELLGFDAATIDALNNDERRWEQRVEEFADYRQRWQKTGILPMLRQMMINHGIAENLLASQGGERRLTDVLHLGELLQEASTQLENEFAVVRWLALQMESPNPQATNQQLRLESDRHMVQIITVHKSKGLEFPLVFLPFAADFRMQKRPLFHDRQAYGAWLDLSAAQESLRLAEEERLAEDLRLFYVALTRSIYHCSLGIAPLYRGSRKKTGASDLHLSAPGYLIQQGQDGDADDLHDRLVALVARADGDIALCEARAESAQPLIPIHAPAPALSARNWPTPLCDPWRVTSYSALQQHGSSVVMELQPRLDVDAAGEGGQQERPQLTPHTFPRGASPGTFLHGLFATLDFNRPLDPQRLSEQLAQQGIDTVWLSVLTHWMESIIAMPLDGGSLSLAHLAPDSRLAELSFYLPIDAVVQARDVDLLCKSYDLLSARCPPLDFPQVKGMLKGFIDLVFRWQGRYYLLDYKSNWLGKESADYALPAMEQAMIAHRYELQYQLYTLALHRFLRHRLMDYDYQRDFGGVYYLFLRGIDAAQPGNGVLHCRPDMALIDGLDRLFTGETRLAAQSG
ncbi:MAG: RecBCD enzyme subunit RecB [Sodalis sp.]|uniref:exodeoxyribonuclease V subunit beta n=1 Tax=Sodalis sp. (in: enterobacteria) TaxID=1898979 RepID=UPI003872AB43|nr:MAG: RecBCD enzyme subunit RecB [Sodalis sp.]